MAIGMSCGNFSLSNKAQAGHGALQIPGTEGNSCRAKPKIELIERPVAARSALTGPIGVGFRRR
ncbi:hypothetical protein SBBP2_170005 [Burkholderiales bacterium]|nr:hypothetical protein SBBP2_170005 [Burkholderiales bacterium]